MLSEFELAFTFIKNVCIKVGIYIPPVTLTTSTCMCCMYTVESHHALEYIELSTTDKRVPEVSPPTVFPGIYIYYDRGSMQYHAFLLSIHPT